MQHTEDALASAQTQQLQEAFLLGLGQQQQQQQQQSSAKCFDKKIQEEFVLYLSPLCAVSAHKLTSVSRQVNINTPMFVHVHQQC